MLSRPPLKKLYKALPSRKIVEIEGFETEADAALAAGGVKCWVLTSWGQKRIFRAVRHFDSKGGYTYHYTGGDGQPNTFRRWNVRDFATFAEAKAALLLEHEEELKRYRQSLANEIKKRNEVRSMRAPKKDA